MNKYQWFGKYKKRCRPFLIPILIPYTLHDGVAQLVEHRTHKPKVVGSIPTLVTRRKRCIDMPFYFSEKWLGICTVTMI